MSEIRLNESLLGATHVDLLRVRITITPAEDPADAADLAEAAEVATLDERRRRLPGGAS